MMLKALLKPRANRLPHTSRSPPTTPWTWGRTLRFLHALPALARHPVQSYLEEESFLFTGDIFGCHFCDPRLFNDSVGDFRFSFEYYYAHIMRPFRENVLDAVALIEPLDLKLIAPAHGPMRHMPRDYVHRYRELATRDCSTRPAAEDPGHLHISACNGPPHGGSPGDRRREHPGVRVSLYDLEGANRASSPTSSKKPTAWPFGSPRSTRTRSSRSGTCCRR